MDSQRLAAIREDDRRWVRIGSRRQRRQLLAEVDRLQALVQQLKSVASDQIAHLYDGNCPDAQQLNSRDPLCPACRAMGCAS